MEFPELVEEDHLKQRKVWLEWETADGETFKGLTVFPRFKNNPGRVWRPMPHQGEDTRPVLEGLGYTQEEIDRLAQEGVVKTYEG